MLRFSRNDIGVWEYFRDMFSGILIFQRNLKRIGVAKGTIISNCLFMAFTGDFSSSPNVFVGDPMFPEKNLDSRPEALRE